MAEQSARSQFEALVQESAPRPKTAHALCAQLEGQLAYQDGDSDEGLEELAAVPALALTRGTAAAEPQLGRLARGHDRQALCHFYLLAARLELGDLDGARDELEAVGDVDPGDPRVDLFRLGLAAQRPPAVSEEVRPANIAKLAETPLLSSGSAVSVMIPSYRCR